MYYYIYLNEVCNKNKNFIQCFQPKPSCYCGFTEQCVTPPVCERIILSPTAPLMIYK